MIYMLLNQIPDFKNIDYMIYFIGSRPVYLIKA